MCLRNLVPFWIVAVIALFVDVGLSAPAPKDKPEPKAAPQEEAAEPAALNVLSVRAARLQSENNLKQLGLASANFESVYGKLPKNVMDKDGKALLSWRVHLLPYIEQAPLYNQFKLDEPWDSENNIKLLETMPKVFDNPRVKLKKKGYTVYLGFEGEDTVFGPKFDQTLSITDGTSNTIFCVESSLAVPWTKPTDLPFDPKKDVPDFGKAYGGKPIVALCDGSIRILDTKKLSAKTLKSAIMPNDGNPLGQDW